MRTAIEDCTSKWDVTHRLIDFTSDNGSEMCRKIRLIANSICQSDFHVRYLAHIDILAVNAAFNKSYKCLSSIQKIVSDIRLSVKRRERFDVKNALNSENTLLPALDVEMRCSSTGNMLNRALKAKYNLNTMCSERESLHQYAIAGLEWTVATKICNLLRLFQEAIANQGGSQYVSLSMTSPVYEIQVDAVDNFNELKKK